MTFAGAVVLYDAKPAEAAYLLKIVPEIGQMRLRDIKPKYVRDVLAPKLYPKAATDTWRRQVIVPVSAVINNAHDLGRYNSMIRIVGYSTQERLDQDRKRGKGSRQEKVPGSWDWIKAFRAEANPYLAAMALFMFTTGARISQAVQIRPRDLDLQNCRVMMPAAKGHPAMWVSLLPAVVADLANLPPRGGKVFGYASRYGVYGSWRRVCKRAGIDERMPHAAGRHGFGTELIVRQGLDPVTVAAEGRWSSRQLVVETYSHSDGGTKSVHEAMQRGLRKASKQERSENKTVDVLQTRKRK